MVNNGFGYDRGNEDIQKGQGIADFDRANQRHITTTRQQIAEWKKMIKKTTIDVY